MYLMVILFTALLSTHIHQKPTFLGTIKVEIAHELMLSHSNRLDIKSSTYLYNSLCSDVRIQLQVSWEEPILEQDLWCCMFLEGANLAGKLPVITSWNSFNRGWTTSNMSSFPSIPSNNTSANATSASFIICRKMAQDTNSSFDWSLANSSSSMIEVQCASYPSWKCKCSWIH